MPCLSFSCKEILQALLNHKKTQTIRLFPIEIAKSRNTKEFLKAEWFKKPRLRVGQVVSLYWKQRSRKRLFCNKCGEGGNDFGGEIVCKHECKEFKLFPKLIGKVKLTEVFQIEMWKSRLPMEGGGYSIKDLRFKPYFPDGSNIDKVSQENLARKDGFKSAEDFFRYFDKAYDLSQLKRFAVFRWRWI